jgi:hypothetical protein
VATYAANREAAHDLTLEASLVAGPADKKLQIRNSKGVFAPIASYQPAGLP